MSDPVPFILSAVAAAGGGRPGRVRKLLQPLAQGGNASAINRIDATRTANRRLHQTGFPQDPKMLRYRRSTHRKTAGQFSHSRWCLRQSLEYRSPGRIGEGTEGLDGGIEFVSHNLP